MQRVEALIELDYIESLHSIHLSRYLYFELLQNYSIICKMLGTTAEGDGAIYTPDIYATCH